jgi:lysylphosphatidylglycerol synthetase-like protein (DUF2156 family)
MVVKVVTALVVTVVVVMIVVVLAVVMGVVERVAVVTVVVDGAVLIGVGEMWSSFLCPSCMIRYAIHMLALCFSAHLALHISLFSLFVTRSMPTLSHYPHSTYTHMRAVEEQMDTS